MGRGVAEVVRKLKIFNSKILGLLMHFTVIAGLLFFTKTAAADVSNPSNFIWYSSHKTLNQIDTAANQVIQTISIEDKADALAIDPKDNSLWALIHKQLFKYDAAGNLLFQINLKNLSEKIEEPKHLLLNPYDSSIYVSAEKTILHIDSNGRLLQKTYAPNEIKVITIALDEGLRLFGENQLIHLSGEGTLLNSYNIDEIIEDPKHMAIDSLNNLIWLGGEENLILNPA